MSFCLTAISMRTARAYLLAKRVRKMGLIPKFGIKTSGSGKCFSPPGISVTKCRMHAELKQLTQDRTGCFCGSVQTLSTA